MGDLARDYAGRSGPGSGKHWSDGIYNSDWSLWDGSASYKEGIAQGFTDWGGNLYNNYSKSEKIIYNRTNNEYGYFTYGPGGVRHSYKEVSTFLNRYINYSPGTLGTWHGTFRPNNNKGELGWVGLGRDFANGFMNTQPSDMQSTSAFLGYSGIPVAKNEAILKYTAKTASGWGNKAAALRAVKGIAITGKVLGVSGAIVTGIESAYDANGFTVGDGVKVGVGLLTTFGGPIGLGYGFIDIGIGLYTGTTLTDRIGAGVDSAMN